MMLSGVGPAHHLQQMGIPVIHDSPGVGQNLQDHIAVGGIVFLVDYPVSTIITRLVNLQAALRYAHRYVYKFSLHNREDSSLGFEYIFDYSFVLVY